MAKFGRTLEDLAREITRQSQAKRDYLVPTGVMSMTLEVQPSAEAGAPPVLVPQIAFGEGEQAVNLGLRQLAHRQIGEFAKIPAPYYDRMLATQPQLLAENVNTWLRAESKTRLVRVLDDRMRAFLSDSYRPLENIDLAEAVLPVLGQLEVEIVSSEITEQRFYIKAVDKRIVKDIPTGRKLGDGSHVFFDTLSPAIIISNSEVGAGALSVETAIWTKVCTNLASFGTNMRKFHLGARADIGEELFKMLSPETRKLSDKALWSQARDVVKNAFEQTQFEALTGKLVETTEQELTGKIEKVVELVGRKFEMAEGERESVLQNLIKGGDLTRYGLFNAITRTAEDLPSYDRATQFERFGGKIIDLPANDFRVIAEAA